MPGSQVAKHAHLDRTNHSIEQRIGLLDVIWNALDQTGLISMYGPYGFGKTTLLHEFNNEWKRAYGRQRAVVYIDCSSSESHAFISSYRGNVRDGMVPAHASQSAWSKVAHNSIIQDQDQNDWFKQQLPYNSLAINLRDPTFQRYGYGIFASVVNEPVSRLIWTYLNEYAGCWVDLCAKESADTKSAREIAPLLLIDNLPLFDEEEDASLFEKAVRVWLAFGACVVLVSEPSASLAESHFSDFACLTSQDLVVSETDYAMWSRDLCLPNNPNIMKVTMGIPALIDACRTLMPNEDIWHNENIIDRSGEIISYCINEPAVTSVDKIKHAMVLLSHGTIRDLTDVCGNCRRDDLALIDRFYPMFHLSNSKGSFQCLITSVSSNEALFKSIVGSDDSLARACIGKLLERGQLSRAVALTRFVSNDSLIRLMGSYPLAFADLDDKELTQRCLNHAKRVTGLPPNISRGLGLIYIVQVLMREGKFPHDNTVYDDQSFEQKLPLAIATLMAIDNAWTLTALGRSRRAKHPQVNGVEKICRDMSRAVLTGNLQKYNDLKMRLETIVVHTRPFLRGLVAHHIAICGILLGQNEEIADYIAAEYTKQKASENREDILDTGEGPETITAALLQADEAFARMLSTKLGDHDDWNSYLSSITEARLFIERHQVVWALPGMKLIESLAYLALGNDKQAQRLLEQSASALGTREHVFGQALALSFEAFTRLGKNDYKQAGVAAQTAEKLFSRIKASRWQSLSKLACSLAMRPLDNSRTCDGRLLEVTMQVRQDYPHQTIALDIELAVLSLASEDEATARDTLGGIATGRRIGDIRLACMAICHAGELRDPLTRLLPDSMTNEIQAIDDTQRRISGSLMISSVGSGKPLTVQLLGSLKIELNGHRVDGLKWGRQKSRSLFLFLAAQPGQRISRARAARLLWPQGNPAAQRNNLSAVLTTVRRFLGQCHDGPEFIITNDEDICLNPELVYVDIDTFEREARSLLSATTQEPQVMLNRFAHLARDYAGGMVEFEGQVADAQLWYARKSALAALFVDCMLQATNLALKVNEPVLALRFAVSARNTLPWRTDVMQACAAVGISGSHEDGSLQAPVLPDDAFDTVDSRHAIAVEEIPERAGGEASPDHAPGGFIDQVSIVNQS